MVAILDAQNMSDWNKDLSSCIWPWREPVLGVALVFGGVRTILTHEFHDRTWAYHGFTADFAGVLMLLGAALLFRGRIWRKQGWHTWIVLDKIIGAIVGAGVLYFIAQRWISVL